MISTFHGLETARRGMMTSQAALHTTGHNIANANTPGYTRQRVNFTQTEPYPAAGRNAPMIPGQVGTGVEAGSIQRMRDAFIDAQFRGENSKSGYWEARTQLLSQMENIMNEPTEEGLANTMDQFWASLQDLAVQPQDAGAREVVQQRGVALADTFNYVHNSLKAIQTDYRNEIEVTKKNANSILRQINMINKQISEIEPHGYIPNDLYDERDRLVDDLSGIMNIKVEKIDSSGKPDALAEGLYNIYLADEKGDKLTDSYGNEVQLVNASTNVAYGIHVQYETPSDKNSPVEKIEFYQLNNNSEGFVTGINPDTQEPTNITNGTPEITDGYNFPSFSAFMTRGELTAFIEGYGYIEDPAVSPTETKGLYPEMMANLDEMARTFVEYFNRVHNQGWSINEIDDPAASSYDFFEFVDSNNPAATLKVTDDILDDIENIAAASVGKSMIREDGVRAYSDPVVTGTFNPGGGTDPIVLKVECTAYDSATGVSTYSVSDNDGNTDTIVSTDNPPEATIRGLKINVATIASPNTGDTWELTISSTDEQPGDAAYIGDGSNARALADVKHALLSYNDDTTSVHSFYQGVIGDMGVNASEAIRMGKNAQVLKDSVEQRRMSISSVSLDEEMTNMIKFQHAYNAAARNITLVDEMLDKIINGMGLVGR